MEGRPARRSRIAGLDVAGYTRRQAVSAWARSYPFAPRFRDAERVRLDTADGVSLSGWWLPGPPGATTAIVLAHGVMHHARNPKVLAFAERLGEEVPVLVLDLRGHGRSGGHSTLGAKEPLDVGAGVREVARRSGLPVVSIGISLGGSAVLLQAGREGGVVGVVAISAPAFTDWSRPGAARLHRFASSPVGRRVAAALLRTRIAADFGDVVGAQEAVASIGPAWIVLVHDPYDHYFGPEHPSAVAGWATGPLETWWEAGAGPGTDLLDAGLAARILDRIADR
ncbi:MAG: alpha/beta fold hydrolase [Acidimicrobiales bacterium]